MRILSHRELRVWQDAVDAAMQVFELTGRFPAVERYSLVDQVRRSSRSVAANVAEAWRKRRYEAAFVSKLSDAEAEAGETQTWLEFCRRCGYATDHLVAELDATYERIIGQLVVTMRSPEKWRV